MKTVPISWFCASRQLGAQASAWQGIGGQPRAPSAVQYRFLNLAWCPWPFLEAETVSEVSQNPWHGSVGFVCLAFGWPYRAGRSTSVE